MAAFVLCGLSHMRLNRRPLRRICVDLISGVVKLDVGVKGISLECRVRSAWATSPFNSVRDKAFRRVLFLPQVCYNTNMKLMRDRAKLCKMADGDDAYVEASPAERVGFVWEITKELWSLRNRQDAERRLQRNAANLVRQQG